MDKILDRAADQVVIARWKWQKTLVQVLIDLMAEIHQKEREKQFWKREFYKQEDRATKAQKEWTTLAEKVVDNDIYYHGNVTPKSVPPKDYVEGYPPHVT